MGTSTTSNPRGETDETEREVSLKEGLGNQDLRGTDVDQAPNDPKEQEQESAEDVLEVLQSRSEQRVQTFGKDQTERRYIQKPLSFIAKMEWFSLVGDVLDAAMGGPNPLTVNSLLDVPNRGGVLSLADFRDADMFVHAIGKLLKYAPDFLEESFCIWLAVPRHDRALVRELMRLDAEHGGLSDEDGMLIIETFIDQNYEALDSFFRERLGRAQSRIRQRAKEASESRQSKR